VQEELAVTDVAQLEHERPPEPVAGAGRRLRIAVVTPELLRTRGTERANSEFVARMALEHDVHLFAHHWQPAPGDPAVSFHRVPVIPWPGLARFLSFFAAASLAVAREERRGAFHCVYSPGANCMQVDVSTAWFCQARQLALFRSGRHRPAPESLMDWLKLAHRWSYARVVAGVERAFYRSARRWRVIAQSRLLARDLESFYGLDAARTRIAHGGVNASAFTPTERDALRPRARRDMGLKDSQFVFLFIGNNWLIKGLYHAMRALAEVPGALLLVVGADYERTDSWQRLARELGIAERVTYLPRRPDVIYYYAAADALLAPSVYDTFPLMPLEAMACGLPTIISAQTGTAEIVTGEETIVVSSPENTPELAEAMRRLASDTALRARLVAAGLAFAQRHSWDNIYAAVTEEMLAVAEQSAGKNGRHA
jgi:glycosyltransferase involved in cell wall biosynthesis